VKATHYYVLINFKLPTFLSEEDGEPVRFYEIDDARRAAKKEPACKAVGYSVLAWDPVQGGYGALSVESWSAAEGGERDGE
jgi:hypothetical protein